MSKFFAGVFTVSFLAVLYIFQQASLIEYSYDIQSNQQSLSLLVDQNRQLRYNVAKLEGPAHLENVLAAKKTDVYTPQKWYKILIPAKNEKLLKQQVPVLPVNTFMGSAKVILSMLSVDTEAVARELDD